MNILGVELELNLFDADVLEVYEKENQRLLKRIRDNEQYKGKSTADALRYQCGVVNGFFDSLFGNGTAEKIFQGKNDIKEHMEAFAVVSKKAEDSNVEFDNVIDKYTSNRAERRQFQKQHQKQNFQNYQKNHATNNGNNGRNHN